MDGSARPRTDRRTFWGLAGDMLFFGVGATFAGQTTVVPAFLARLTDSAPLIGLASTISTGAWLLPQLFAANRLLGLARKKPSVLIPATAGRLVALLLGPAMLLLAGRDRTTALAVFYLLYLAFWTTDGIASIAWLVILGKCLTPTSRARLISLGTAAPGVAGIGAGVLVAVVLSSPRLLFPSNYALLFGISGVLFTLSLLSFLCIRETPDHAVQRPLPWPAYFRRLAAVTKSDPGFRRAVIAQLAVGGIGVAAPFYVVHGLEGLGFPPSSVGLFTSVQLVGGLFSSLVMGLLGERRGTRSVMRLWGCFAVCAPLIALAAPALRSLLPAGMMYVYAAVFVVVGMQGNANMAGFLNWVLEYAPSSERPLYIGFANTLNGVTLVMPLIGGWILSATSSYPVLFAAAAVGPAAALVILGKLPEPRHGGSHERREE